MQHLHLLLLLLLNQILPSTSLVGGLPVTQSAVDAGAISHHVVVHSIGGTPQRSKYKSTSVRNVTIANCTGLLLTPNFVLVPARCVSDMATPGEQRLAPNAITIQHSCGLHTPWSQNDEKRCKTVHVAAVFIHPCWRTRTPSSLGETTQLDLLGDHDVAVLRLASPVPSVGVHQRYAVLDDGALQSTTKKKATEINEKLIFRGYGPFDNDGTLSASMRETEVRVSDPKQCVERFDAAMSGGGGGGEGGEPRHRHLNSGASKNLYSTRMKSLNFLDRQVCVGDDGLTDFALRGGCPNGDVGGPIETKDGIVVGELF
jgi:hypothetical protein